jgi:hypothetical protein
LILEKLCGRHGDKHYAELEPRHIRQRRDARTETPEAATVSSRPDLSFIRLSMLRRAAI